MRILNWVAERYAYCMVRLDWFGWHPWLSAQAAACRLIYLALLAAPLLLSQITAIAQETEKRLSVIESNHGLMITVFSGVVVVACGAGLAVWKEISMSKAVATKMHTEAEERSHQVSMKLEEMNGNMKVQNTQIEDVQNLIRSITTTSLKSTPVPPVGPHR